jgi:hypothetical protein
MCVKCQVDVISFLGYISTTGRRKSEGEHDAATTGHNSCIKSTGIVTQLILMALIIINSRRMIWAGHVAKME